MVGSEWGWAQVPLLLVGEVQEKSCADWGEGVGWSEGKRGGKNSTQTDKVEDEVEVEVEIDYSYSPYTH